TTAGWYRRAPPRPEPIPDGGLRARILVVAGLAQRELAGALGRVGADGEDAGGGPAGDLAVHVDRRTVQGPLGSAHDLLARQRQQRAGVVDDLAVPVGQPDLPAVARLGTEDRQPGQLVALGRDIGLAVGTVVGRDADGLAAAGRHPVDLAVLLL